jgi:hypothetical protein
MGHFTDEYMDRVIAILHNVLTATWFYKQEIIEVPSLVTAFFITYDGVLDDSREVRDQCSWENFQERLSSISDWHLDQKFIKEAEEKNPKFAFGGWERRTMYLMRAGSHPEHWTVNAAIEDTTNLLMSAASGTAKAIQAETEHLREIVPPGPEHFQAFEYMVRVVFNFLFIGELGEGKAQSRTEPEDEGVEIRDLIFANNAESGFWNDLKRQYSASQIVVDAKNKDELTRDDLRQLYCYLKPALGYWGFIVCRSEQSRSINAFNRTLFRNFNQVRGLLILNDDDLRRMVQIKLRHQNPAMYLQDRMSEFVRSI